MMRHLKTGPTGSTCDRASGSSSGRLVAAVLAALALGTLLLASGAQASMQAVDFFGGAGSFGGEFSGAAGVAVNNSGAGPANSGDIYVLDPGPDRGNPAGRNNRIERFGHDDKGTADPADDTYFFISAWGADVDSTPSGGSDYEICVLASECQAATGSGGNGTQIGNGALDNARSVAIDQDTGYVYVSDAGNSRVSVYAGDGVFLRSFGYDVVASGPDQVPAPSEQQQLTVKASGGKFSLSFNGESTGATGTGLVFDNSKVVTGVETTSGTFAVGQVFSAFNTFLNTSLFPPGTTITAVGAGSITLSEAALGNSGGQGPGELIGDSLDFDASAAEVQTALNALPTIGGVGGSVVVSGGPGDESGSAPYTIDFGGTLAGDDVRTLVPTRVNLTINSGTASAVVTEQVKGGAYETCEAGVDICKAGLPGPGIGQVGDDTAVFAPAVFGIAVSQPDGNPATGTVFLADAPNHRVDTYGLDGSSPGSIGSAAVFYSNPELERDEPNTVAVDSRGIVYASNQKNEGEIERYDFENTNGGGVGFLAPIPAGINEVQQVTIGATAGQFRLSFEGGVTNDIAFDATSSVVEKELQALIPVGANNVSVTGGPGNASGSAPYVVRFRNGLGAKDTEQISVSGGATLLSGGAGASSATTTPGQSGLVPESSRPTIGFTVDPDSDGVGPDADALYVLRNGEGSGSVQVFGPLNSPGLTAPPTDEDDRHATNPGLIQGRGLAIDEATGLLYGTGLGVVGFSFGSGVYVFGETGPPPTASLDALTGGSSHSVVAHATIDPNGRPDTSYHFEYSTDGTYWSTTPTVLLGHQEDPQGVEATIDPPPVGLLPNTSYQIRLVVSRKFAKTVITDPLSFTTDSAKPIVESTGTPVRGATAAQLLGRVDPNGSATTYHFEYGDQGPCDSNPCTSTPEQAAGAGLLMRLAAERVEGLLPSTTYHYRIVADNSAPGAPIAGSDMTVATRASDNPLSREGHFPGPPDSDRAYEMVSMPDSGGNPVFIAEALSSDGNRAIYNVAGGTPISEAGSFFSYYFAQRPAGAHPQSGWQTSLITPPRAELLGPSWFNLYGSDDLSAVISLNVSDGPSEGERALWRLAPGSQSSKLFQATPPRDIGGLFSGEPGTVDNSMGISADGSRVVMSLKGGSLDPAYPTATATTNFYDVSSGGVPQLLSLLPGESPGACGLTTNGGVNIGAFADHGAQASHWISADGSLVFFASRGNGPCSGSGAAPSQIYVREIGAAQTKLISGPPLSGPSCEATFVKATPEAAFIATNTRLSIEDTATDDCSGNKDVYRYGLTDQGLKCLTCLVTGLPADVTGSSAHQIAVAEDGSRLYFESKARLAAGAPEGSLGIYRVEVDTGDLAYVAEAGVDDSTIDTVEGGELTPSGSTLLFRSNLPALDPLGGASDNGGSNQYYRYDDRDRSLVCVTCPTDGSAPLGPAEATSNVAKPNLSLLADDGNTFAFTTATPLVGADQNTPPLGGDTDPAIDVYEWRDGRIMLVTDGLSSWSSQPRVKGVSASGRDVFFNASAQYTADALDANSRLYDARIGGGMDFPAAPQPCPLEVCQGVPKGAPEEATPGTGSLLGPGNAKPSPSSRCRKGKVRRKGRCITKPRKRTKQTHKRTKHDRGTTR